MAKKGVKKKASKKAAKKVNKSEAAKDMDSEPTQKKDEVKDPMPSKKVLKNETKQVIYFGIIVIVLFVSFFVPYFYIKSQRVFEHNNLTWQVETDGEVTFYHTQFGKYYRGEYKGAHNTFLRNDPRKNNIPVELNSLSFYNDIKITTDSELLTCQNQILVTDALAQMSQGIAFVDSIEFGVTDRDLAKESNREYISCSEVRPESTIIHVKKGETSRVTQSSDDCIIVEIAECADNLKTAEKLVLEVVTQLAQAGSN